MRLQGDEACNIHYLLDYLRKCIPSFSEYPTCFAVWSIFVSVGISLQITTPAGLPPWLLCENAAILNTSIDSCPILFHPAFCLPDGVERIEYLKGASQAGNLF
jgi:hypothetical protein